MDRCTVSFNNDTLNKLQKKAESSGKSVAEIVRNLVDMALEMEQFSKESPQEKSSSSLSKLDDLATESWLKSPLSWMLETRLLIRYLVANLDSEKHPTRFKDLDRFKDEAKQHIDELLVQLNEKSRINTD